MEIRRSLTAPCGPDVLFGWVDDLAHYPQWMKLVHGVELLDAVDGQPAWQVELRAQVGPFARSKALRMVRSVHDAPHAVTFERRELDGRDHSAWTLRATVEPVDDPDSRTGSTVAGSVLTMKLRYGGSLWTGAVLQRVLDDAVRRGSDELLAIVSASPTR